MSRGRSLRADEEGLGLGRNLADEDLRCKSSALVITGLKQALQIFAGSVLQEVFFGHSFKGA